MALLAALPAKRQWVVYTEPPFGRSTHVLKYLGRYTHRIAISDARLVSADDRAIRFRTRGDATTELPPELFVARFLQHVLPAGYHKIRHFGLYSPARAHTLLQSARSLLGAGDQDKRPPADDSQTWDEQLIALGVTDPLRCPACDSGHLERRGQLPRAPPRQPTHTTAVPP